MNTKLTFSALAAILMMGLFTSCDGGKTIATSALDGHWYNGKIISGFGEMDSEIIFEISENDSTAGTFIMFFAGTCNDTDEDSTKFSIRYLAAVDGTYKVTEDKLTLSYIPDSLGVRVNLEDVMEHAIVKQNNGTKGDVNEIAKEFRHNIVDFIGSSFEEMFNNLNKAHQSFTIKLLDSSTLVISENDGDQTITYTRSTGANDTADDENEDYEPDEEVATQDNLPEKAPDSRAATGSR